MYIGMCKKIISSCFFKYSCIGLLNTGLYSVILWVLLQKEHINIEFATIIALFFSMVFQFTMNKKFTFNSNVFSKFEILKYICLVVINYMISIGCLKILINFYQLEIELALLMNIVILTITGYLMSNYWVFKKNE
jgi:putative flippase GtrA